MLHKLIKQHGQNSHFHKPRATNSPFFGIVHFAGTVYYDTRGVCTACVVFSHTMCTIAPRPTRSLHPSLPSPTLTSLHPSCLAVLGFLDKNRDTFSADLFDLLHTTKNPFLASLFSGDKAMVRCTAHTHLHYS